MAMGYIHETLDANATSSKMMVNGYADILVSGLASGTVKVQALFPGQTLWLDLPGFSFTADTFKTVFMSEDQVKLRFVGVSNDECVVRIGQSANRG